MLYKGCWGLMKASMGVASGGYINITWGLMGLMWARGG